MRIQDFDFQIEFHSILYCLIFFLDYGSDGGAFGAGGRLAPVFLMPSDSVLPEPATLLSQE